MTEGTPPYTYIWSDNLSQTTSTAVGLCLGNYNVTVYDADGDSITGNVGIGTIPGYDEFDFHKYWVIYPNPNTGHFSILISGIEQDLLAMKVFTVEGRLILEKSMPTITGKQSEDLDISFVGPGLYYVQVILSKGTSVKKIIVQ